MIWSTVEKKEVFSFKPLKKSSRIIGIAQVDDNTICLSADSTFFVFDYADKKIKASIEPGYGMIFRMIHASDGYVYAVAKRAILRYDIQKNIIEKLFNVDGEPFINFVIEDKDKRIFFAINENIYELKKTK
jgi:argininosuccinate lyase